MKTAEEVADEIWDNTRRKDMTTSISIIAQALTAYAEERVKEVQKEMADSEEGLLMASEKATAWAYAKARAEALEEAAKVSEAQKHFDDAGMIRALKDSK